MPSNLPASESQVREVVRAYLLKTFLYMYDSFALDDDDRLLEKGVIDSVGIVELLVFLEEEFGVVPADDEVTEDNFGSVRAIAEYVTTRSQQPPDPVP